MSAWKAAHSSSRSSCASLGFEVEFVEKKSAGSFEDEDGAAVVGCCWFVSWTGGRGGFSSSGSITSPVLIIPSSSLSSSSSKNPIGNARFFTSAFAVFNRFEAFCPSPALPFLESPPVAELSVGRLWLFVLPEDTVPPLIATLDLCCGEAMWASQRDSDLMGVFEQMLQNRAPARE